MTNIGGVGVNSKVPAERASAFYHMRVHVEYEARVSRFLQPPLTTEQEHVLRFFIKEVERERKRALEAVHGAN